MDHVQRSEMWDYYASLGASIGYGGGGRGGRVESCSTFYIAFMITSFLPIATGTLGRMSGEREERWRASIHPGMEGSLFVVN